MEPAPQPASPEEEKKQVRKKAKQAAGKEGSWAVLATGTAVKIVAALPEVLKVADDAFLIAFLSGFIIAGIKWARRKIRDEFKVKLPGVL